MKPAPIGGISAKQEGHHIPVRGFSELGERLMAAPRRVIEVAFTEEELADLERVSRSRTEPAESCSAGEHLVDLSPDALALCDRARGRREPIQDGRAMSAARTDLRRQGGAERDSSASRARADHHQRSQVVRAKIDSLACRKAKDFGPIRTKCDHARLLAGTRGANALRRSDMPVWPVCPGNLYARYWPRRRSSRTGARLSSKRRDPDFRREDGRKC